MSFLRLILIPLSLLYFIIISIRNFLFNNGILKGQHFNTPIISIGNITTGGTGKTPMVMYLAEYLILKGKSVGVISRGYKSNAKSLIIAYNGVSIISDVQSTGDELSMIVNRFENNPKFFAIAYHNRAEAIDVMETKFAPDIIILDDAFQNRWIKKTIDIVIIDKENKSFLNNILLPAGNLRETNNSLKRADIVYNNYKFDEPNTSESNIIEYLNSGFYDSKGNRTEIRNGKEAVLISGIANNSSFQNAIVRQKISIYKTYELSDHYSYKAADVNNYKNDFHDNVVFITTEKDFIKLREFKDFVSNYPVYYLRIDVILHNSLLDNLLNKKNIL